METAFDRALARTLGIEGGYSNDPVDRGGKTRYGITERVARANGYTGPMDQLPAHWATRIYRAQYWDLLRLDAIAYQSEAIALELFDTGVNMGTGIAAEFLQRCLNALNREGADFADIAVDGAVGPVTVAALREYLQRRGADGERVLKEALNSLQGAREIEIAENDPSQERFTYGRLLHRVA